MGIPKYQPLYYSDNDTDEAVVGDIPTTPTTNSRDYHVGTSDYSKHKIQPWDIWLEYKLDPWDADIIKRVLRTKEGESRITEYQKIIHICNEKINQLRDRKSVV